MINDFKGLLRVVRAVGVNISMQEKRWANELYQGVDVDEKDLVRGGSEAFYDVSESGEIRRVIVYITQQIGPRGYLKTEEDLFNQEKFHKFHLFYCSTIKSYKLKRYRKTTRSDNRFRYHLIWNNQEIDAEGAVAGRELRLCKNCWSLLENLALELDEIGTFNSFNLEEFIKSGVTVGGLSPSSYLPEVGDRLRLYPDDWDEISRSVKERRNWECEECGISLKTSEFRRFLQAHHKDGDPSFNTLGNLQVLCIRCHAEQPMHGHIKHDPAYKRFCEIADKMLV